MRAEMVVRNQQLSKFTLLSIEALYFAGSFLGTTGVLAITSGRTDGDFLSGVRAIIIALVFQTISHKSLIRRHSEPYYLLGAIFVGLVGSMLLVVAPLPWLFRGSLIIFLIVIAVHIRLGNPFLQRIWQGISLWCCLVTLLSLAGRIFVSTWAEMIIPAIYLLVCIVIAIRYRWVRRPAKPIVPTTRFDIPELWLRGRIPEIFGVPKDGSRLQYAGAYNDLLSKYKGHNKIEKILKDALEIHNVHPKWSLYCRARDVMDDIRKKVGDNPFEKRESTIWQALWGEMEKKFNLSPEKVTDKDHKELVSKYLKKHF